MLPIPHLHFYFSSFYIECSASIDPLLAVFFITFAAFSFCVAIGMPQLVVAQDKHPFTSEDSSVLHRATTLSVSPDGKAILYVVSYEGDKGPRKREWRLVDTSGGNARKLDLPESFEPAGFTREGTALYGIYEVDKKGQLGIVPITGGKPTHIIAPPNGIRGTTNLSRRHQIRLHRRPASGRSIRGSAPRRGKQRQQRLRR
jgi:hypothetical protein